MYSGPVRRVLLHPNNGRPGGHYNGEGTCETEVRCRSNPERTVKNRVTFNVCVENGTILESRWQIFGDPVAIAVASWCVFKSSGKKVNDLVNVITPEMASMDLHISDELDIRAGCMTSIQAFINALDDYHNRLKCGFH